MAKDWKAVSMQKVNAEQATNICPECKSEDVTNESGEIFCKKCGFVLSD
jgi:ribosomal protein L37AE/L43A|tara:strand:+ start:261 stop:407 length:147 start_codon:yes stop_codon:yes gene_type:complete